MKQTCPKCRGEAIEILYGFPSIEAHEAEKRGEIALGGCCVSTNDYAYECRDCQHRFGLSYISKQSRLRLLEELEPMTTRDIERFANRLQWTLLIDYQVLYNDYLSNIPNLGEVKIIKPKTIF